MANNLDWLTMQSLINNYLESTLVKHQW